MTTNKYRNRFFFLNIKLMHNKFDVKTKKNLRQRVNIKCTANPTRVLRKIFHEKLHAKKRQYLIGLQNTLFTFLKL